MYSQVTPRAAMARSMGAFFMTMERLTVSRLSQRARLALWENRTTCLGCPTLTSIA